MTLLVALLPLLAVAALFWRAVRREERIVRRHFQERRDG